MSAPLTDEELHQGDWVAMMAIRLLIWQFRTHRRHYLGRLCELHGNHVHYLLSQLKSYYFASPRGWRRQFRRKPAKLANCVYHDISCELRGRP